MSTAAPSPPKRPRGRPPAGRNPRPPHRNVHARVDVGIGRIVEDYLRANPDMTLQDLVEKALDLYFRCYHTPATPSP